MPAKFELLTQTPRLQLLTLGQAIKARRKKLKVSALAVSKAAGMSRVTLHRIEAGEPSVAAGAYWAAMVALGMHLELQLEKHSGHEQEGDLIAQRIALQEYPALASLAWHVPGLDFLEPQEAYDIYIRNERHLNPDLLTDREKSLMLALKKRFSGKPSDV